MKNPSKYYIVLAARSSWIIIKIHGYETKYLKNELHYLENKLFWNIHRVGPKQTILYQGLDRLRNEEQQ